MKSYLSYCKNFSALEGLQTARTLQYSLIVEVTELAERFGILVQEIDNGDAWHDCIGPFTDSRTAAERLLTYLYENAVPASSCREVIADACLAPLGNGRGTDDIKHNPITSCR